MCTIIDILIKMSESVLLVMQVVRHTKAQFTSSNSNERINHWTQVYKKEHLFILHKWF